MGCSVGPASWSTVFMLRRLWVTNVSAEFVFRILPVLRA